MGCCDSKNGDISKEFKLRFSSEKVSINEEETNIPYLSLNSPKETNSFFSSRTQVSSPRNFNFMFSPQRSQRDSYYSILLKECYINTNDRHKSYRCSTECSCKNRSSEEQPDEEPQRTEEALEDLPEILGYYQQQKRNSVFENTFGPDFEEVDVDNYFN